MTANGDHEFSLDPLQRAAAEDTADVRGGVGRLRHGQDTHAGRAGGIPAEAGHLPGRIICLTPTDRGAEDLRRRLEMHPDTRGTARRVYVGTFHQYANQILRPGGYMWDVPPIRQSNSPKWRCRRPGVHA